MKLVSFYNWKKIGNRVLKNWLAVCFDTPDTDCKLFLNPGLVENKKETKYRRNENEIKESFFILLSI